MNQYLCTKINTADSTIARSWRNIKNAFSYELFEGT